MTKQQPRRTTFALKAILALLLATILTGAVAPSSASTGTLHRSRALHVTKECSQYTGLADSYCTITSSNVRAITVGSRVVYLQAAAATSLDSDIVVVAGPGNYALGHVTLDFVTSTGEVTIWGGTGHFAHLHARAAVSALGGPNWAWDGTYRFGEHQD
ncbi:MAG TPA: hypothetical protein VIJ15_12520 [Dermatophilaceae bacterium]